MKRQALISLEDLQNRLLIPGRDKPASRTTLYNLLLKLEIKQQIQKKDSYPRAFVTAAEAAEVEKEFRRIHWRKFKTEG